MLRFATCAVLSIVAAPAARAGHSVPNYIDGCRSADGRYVVTAAEVPGAPPKGPFKWTYTWKDTKANVTRTYEAKGVSTGQVYGHLFVPPGGETFALFTGIVMHTNDKRLGDHHAGTVAANDGSEKWRTQELFARRLVVYKSSDGSILKEFAVNDFLKPDEWAAVSLAFTRVHWLRDYPGLSYRNTPRSGYAYYRISPDYSVLEFRVVVPKKKDTDGRVVRVSLTDGKVLADDEKLTKERTPVRPFVGPDKLTNDDGRNAHDRYVPSLDPVRVEGKMTPPADASAPSGTAPADEPKALPPAVKPALELELVRGGYAKADTPTWLPGAKCLLFTDLDQKKLFRLDPPNTVTTPLDGAGRGKVGPDGRFYGIVNGALASWVPGDKEPKVILENAPGDRAFEVNDVAVSAAGFVYLTTLKDPDKGRLTVVDVSKKTATVAWDGEKDADLVNPNGVALAPDGKFLYVGISNYKDRKKSCVYRFAVGADGMPDVAAGKKERFANVSAPDGIAVDTDGTVYFTAGGVVKVFAADGKPAGEIKIPKGSGTNLGFGGGDGRTLYVTTFDALYSCHVPAPTK